MADPNTGQPRGRTRTLKLSYCMNLTDVCLHTLSKRCTKLHTIDLSGSCTSPTTG